MNMGHWLAASVALNLGLGFWLWACCQENAWLWRAIRRHGMEDEMEQDL